jgi:protease-4
MQRAVFAAWIVFALTMPVSLANAADAATTKKDSHAAKAEDSKSARAANKTAAAKKHTAKSDEALSADKSKKKKESTGKSDQARNAKSDQKDEDEDKDEKQPKKVNLVRLTVRGELPERSVTPGLFSELQASLRNVIQRLGDAAEDKSVAAVWLRIENLQIGRGKVNELRDAIFRFRKSGKPIYAELASADSAQYQVAAACDQVVMAPSGTLIVAGVRAEMTFYKGLLDKLGLQFDSLQQGKYKGAAEPFTRSKMSEPLRESMEAVVGDIYETVVQAIAKDRNLPDYQVKSLIDQGLFTAAAAHKAGLVDQLAYGDQIEDLLRKKVSADHVSVITNYKKKEVQTEFSGLGGMVKLMELMFGGGKQTERSTAQKKIALVYAVGAIVEGKGTTSPFDDEVVGSTPLVAALRTAADDPKVVAVVLRIDSPGGSAVGSDLIWRETVRMKKPVIASMGDVAGSGGYYIAMGAKRIIAEPCTLTGSIGVIGGKLVTRGLFDKIGLSTEVISRGKNAGLFSSSQPFTPSERDAWQTAMEDTYRQFVTKAAQGRKMPTAKLEAIAQGRIYTGRMAVANGLVDRLGSLQDAIEEAKRAAHVKADEKVDLQILPRPRSVIEQLFGDPSLAGDVDAVLPEVVKSVRQVSTLKKLFTEPALMLMPCRVEVK